MYPTTKQLTALLKLNEEMYACFMLEMLLYRVLQDIIGPHSVNKNGEHSVN